MFSQIQPNKNFLRKYISDVFVSSVAKQNSDVSVTYKVWNHIIQGNDNLPNANVIKYKNELNKPCPIYKLSYYK